MKNKKQKAGDKLYFVPTGRYKTEPYFVKVTKVGRKYMHVIRDKKYAQEIKIKMDIMFSNWPEGYLYLNKREYEKSILKAKLEREVCDFITDWNHTGNVKNLNFEQIQEIHNIIFKGNDEKTTKNTTAVL
jgi:predicted house-cleaning noncanonical NTP pyrophosphatase (MazG superfamily)